MAHHLPRKKYLSKLLGDSPEDKYTQTSTSSNVDCSSCEKLASNESTESLLTVIANSTSLGISSEFDSTVFTADSNGNCPGAESKDQTNCREGPSSRTQTDSRLQHGTAAADDVDDNMAAESDSSPVYFDDGSVDDDDDDDNRMKNGVADIMEDDVTCSSTSISNVELQTSQMNVIDMTPQSSIPLTASSEQLILPGSVSLSNLIDEDVLNILLPSAESFANLLNSLESKDRPPAPPVQVSSGRSQGQQLYTAGTGEQLPQQQQQQYQLPAFTGCYSAVKTTESASSRRMYTTGKPETSSSSSFGPAVYVKEELIDSGYEVQQQKPVDSTLTTTSGRNRGRGKAAEPKYDCQICGDVAAGYHCGAYVCEACKVSELSITLHTLTYIIIH